MAKNEINILHLARNKPYTGIDFINNIFANFIEFHGDRYFSDDKAIISGIAYLGTMPVTVIAHEKGKETKDKIARNFGSAHPEGYRKALRQIKLAEKFNRPVVCFVDTQGAYCGIGAEERGQGRAIAESLMELSDVKTPIITILIGEGGSGGALALAVSDEVWMLENSIYSVISPEGCASILYKDASKVNLAVENLKIQAKDLKEFKIIEKIIKENDEDTNIMFEHIKKELINTFKILNKLSHTELVRKRYDRFRKLGEIDVCNSN